MATESELAPLEGAALSPVSFESGLPELCSLPPNANVAALMWKSDAALGFSTISQVGVILTLDSRCVLFYVPGTDGSTGAEFGRDGQAGATAETEAPPLRGATCNRGMLLRRCAEV